MGGNILTYEEDYSYGASYRELDHPSPLYACERYRCATFHGNFKIKITYDYFENYRTSNDACSGTRA